MITGIETLVRVDLTQENRPTKEIKALCGRNKYNELYIVKEL